MCEIFIKNSKQRFILLLLSVLSLMHFLLNTVFFIGIYNYVGIENIEYMNSKIVCYENLFQLSYDNLHILMC